MNAIDTNVLIYCIDRHDPVKRAKARTLLRGLQPGPLKTILPWQVLGELVRFLRAWQDRGQITRPALLRYVHLFRNLFPLSMPTPAVLDRALDFSDRFCLSHWDSMLIGACIEAGVDTLYTEDMGTPVAFDGLQLINPFV